MLIFMVIHISVKRLTTFQKNLTATKYKRIEIGRQFNSGINIINSVVSILGAAAIGLSITGLGLWSSIAAAPAMIGIKSVAFVVGIIRVIEIMSRNKNVSAQNKQEKMEMLACTTFNTNSGLIYKAVKDNTISNEENSHNLMSLRWLHEWKKTSEQNLRLVLTELVM